MIRKKDLQARIRKLERQHLALTGSMIDIQKGLHDRLVALEPQPKTCERCGK